MQTFWFCAVALMIAAYVILDGFDLGAGIIHLFVARTEEERRQVLESIGPFWDGNEVWLLAGGGTLFFAFPALYSATRTSRSCAAASLPSKRRSPCLPRWAFHA